MFHHMPSHQPRKAGATTIFEAHCYRRRYIVIYQRRAGAIPRRWLSDTGPAQRLCIELRLKLCLKRHTAKVAARIVDETHATPA